MTVTLDRSTLLMSSIAQKTDLPHQLTDTKLFYVGYTTLLVDTTFEICDGLF